LCKVRGIVFDDKDKDGIRDAGEKGISLVRIALTDDSDISRETFTDVNGKYSFGGIIPGEYTVAIDKKWLPERHKLTTKETHTIHLEPAQEILDINFGSVEKERKIIKTFTKTKVETVHPKEKKKPPFKAQGLLRKAIDSLTKPFK